MTRIYAVSSHLSIVLILTCVSHAHVGPGNGAGPIPPESGVLVRTHCTECYVVVTFAGIIIYACM